VEGIVGEVEGAVEAAQAGSEVRLMQFLGDVMRVVEAEKRGEGGGTVFPDLWEGGKGEKGEGGEGGEGVKKGERDEKVRVVRRVRRVRRVRGVSTLKQKTGSRGSRGRGRASPASLAASVLYRTKCQISSTVSISVLRIVAGYSKGHSDGKGEPGRAIPGSRTPDDCFQRNPASHQKRDSQEGRPLRFSARRPQQLDDRRPLRSSSTETATASLPASHSSDETPGCAGSDRQGSWTPG